ncbi:hypothetical protein IC620_08650 [Hazenella sp. IB182357]|uniref:Uncharacterized protein n=1 Tax=Polycladospora coralii TaxID=2771432 RepID=A0A926N940_9BACL|nr:hypothetical protein [Polycladospora coralii]MBD1372426.1 hypothetical protein [Polycladospora coralii]
MIKRRLYRTLSLTLLFIYGTMLFSPVCLAFTGSSPYTPNKNLYTPNTEIYTPNEDLHKPISESSNPNSPAQQTALSPSELQDRVRLFKFGMRFGFSQGINQTEAEKLTKGEALLPTYWKYIKILGKNVIIDAFKIDDKWKVRSQEWRKNDRAKYPTRKELYDALKAERKKDFTNLRNGYLMKLTRGSLGLYTQPPFKGVDKNGNPVYSQSVVGLGLDAWTAVDTSIDLKDYYNKASGAINSTGEVSNFFGLSDNILFRTGSKFLAKANPYLAVAGMAFATADAFNSFSTGDTWGGVASVGDVIMGVGGVVTPFFPPAGGIIFAVGAATWAIGTAVKNWSAIKRVSSKAYNGMVDLGKGAIKHTTEFINNPIAKTKKTVGVMVKNTVEFAQNPVQKTTEGFSKALDFGKSLFGK